MGADCCSHPFAEQTFPVRLCFPNNQDENMVSNKELAEKYASVQDYEDDFM